jgi:hypothetical protein
MIKRWRQKVLARISHQFRRRQVRSFWQKTIVIYVYCQKLKKMAPHGLTPQGHFLQGAFGEHCVKLVITGFPKNMLDLSSFFQIDTVFMRDAGWSPAYLARISHQFT